MCWGCQTTPQWRHPKGGLESSHAPQGSGCCRSLLVDTSLQNCVFIVDYAFGMADRSGGSPFQERRPEAVFQLPGDHIPQSGKVYSRVLERRIRLLYELWIHWTSSVVSRGYWRGHGSLPNQSTCALLIWRRLMNVFFQVSCGGCFRNIG